MLILKNCENIDDFCLSRLYLFSDTLEFLDISGCSLVTDNGLGALYKLKWVKIHSPFSALWHNTMGTPLRFNFFKLTSLKYELPLNVQSYKLTASLKSELPLMRSQKKLTASLKSELPLNLKSSKLTASLKSEFPLNVKSNLMHHRSVSSFWIWSQKKFTASLEFCLKTCCITEELYYFFIHKSRVKLTNG